MGGARKRAARTATSEGTPADKEWNLDLEDPCDNFELTDEEALMSAVSGSHPPADYVPGQHWKPPRLPHRVWKALKLASRLGTPFVVEAFERALQDYPFPELRAYVLHGLRYGFDTGVDLPEERVFTRNLRSSELNPEAVTEWLHTEVARGHMGVFDELPHEFARTCGMGLVPKPPKDGKLRWRLISDFSRPGANGEAAVNSGIDSDQWRLKMISGWDIVDLMADFGPSCRWSAIDCSWGYRQLDVCPEVYHTQVYEWQGKFYVDYRLVFGSSSSPACYNAVMETVEWIVQQRVDKTVGKGNAAVRHYMDDFACVGRNMTTSKTATTVMLDTFKELGIPLADKDQLNVSVGIYLGIQYNSAAQSLQMPRKKRADVVEMLHRIIDTKTSIKKKMLQSVVGKLTWGHAQWFQSRPLINPLLHAVMTQPRDFGSIKVRDSLRQACRDWLVAIKMTAPRPFSSRPRVLASLEDDAVRCWGEDTAVYCGDASAEVGFGWFNRRCVGMRRWSEAEKVSASQCTGEQLVPGADKPTKNSSTLQELRCMTSAVRHWLTTASAETGICTYLTDARNLVYLVKKGRSKQAGINKELLELGVELRASGKAVRVVWQSREETLAKAADSLSRGLLPPFQQLIPEHPALVVEVPLPQLPRTGGGR